MGSVCASADSVVLSGRWAAVRHVALLLDLGSVLEDAEDIGATSQRGHVVAGLAERLLHERRAHIEHRLEARALQRVHREVADLPGMGHGAS